MAAELRREVEDQQHTGMPQHGQEQEQQQHHETTTRTVDGLSGIIQSGGASSPIREVWVVSEDSGRRRQQHSRSSSSNSFRIMSDIRRDGPSRTTAATSCSSAGSSSGRDFDMDSIPVERTSSLQRDAQTETKKGFDDHGRPAAEQVPSATETEKFTFLWVPISSDADNVVPSSVSSSSSAPLTSLGKPISEKTASSLWRDPYLLALDSAVGRSFSDRTPPLKPLKTERETEDRFKHGVHRPPPAPASSYRYPAMRSASITRALDAPRALVPTPPRMQEVDVELGACQHEQRQQRDSAAESNGRELETSEASARALHSVELRKPPFLESQPTMPCKPIAALQHGDPPKRRALSFATGRFRSSAAASRVPPRSFTRFRSRGAAGDDEDGSPTIPKTPSNAPDTYDMFRTRSKKFSGPLEKQFTKTYSRRCADLVIDEEKSGEDCPYDVDECGLQPAVSAGRYFDALQGPELEVPKVSSILDQHWVLKKLASSLLLPSLCCCFCKEV